MDRTVAAILDRWRDAEARLESDPSDLALQELVARLRQEYQDAIDARADEADELREHERPKDLGDHGSLARVVL